MSNTKWKLNVSLSLDKGGRSYMEDVICNHFEKDSQRVIFGIFGIFDGHGGVQAADFVKNTLKNELIKIEKFWSDDNNEVLEAIKLAYFKVQKLIWIDRENWPRTLTGYKSTSGTTATIVIIRNGILYTGHVGDSGILLVFLNENNLLVSEELTKDHKPEDPMERKRIEASGGSLKFKGGVVRVNWHRETKKKSFLAVARSLGDLWSYDTKTHQYHVSPEPDVQWIKLKHNSHRAVIIGSDGIWNVINRDKCVELITLSNQLKVDGYSINPAQLIINYCLFQWRKKNLIADNVSVIVILLDGGENSVCNQSKFEFESIGLLNEIRDNNLFVDYLTEQSEMLMDNLSDGFVIPKQLSNGDEDDWILLKRYVEANGKLSVCCENWFDCNQYWPILLNAFENVGNNSPKFPNIVLYFDSLSDGYLSELLSGFPWAVCCLELLDLLGLSTQVRSYIKLQPLLTEFWNKFYRNVISNNNNNNSLVIQCTNDTKLSKLSWPDHMRNVLIAKSVDLTNWIKSRISPAGSASATADNNDSLSLSKFSLKKSRTFVHYDFLRDSNERSSNFAENSHSQSNNCLTLKRSASYDISKSQLYCNYNTSFTAFSFDTPLMTPSPSPLPSPSVSSNSSMSTDFESNFSLPTNHNSPYAVDHPSNKIPYPKKRRLMRQPSIIIMNSKDV